jgi:hypothetical protein
MEAVREYIFPVEYSSPSTASTLQKDYLLSPLKPPGAVVALMPTLSLGLPRAPRGRRDRDHALVAGEQPGEAGHARQKRSGDECGVPPASPANGVRI